MMGSGFAGLLGLFAGLCAIFAVFVTLSDWHQETTQARWPVVSAVVDRADVVASVRAPKHGGGTEWKLRYRVRYELNGEARMATLTSRAVFSEKEAAKLQSSAAQHRKGSQIDIRSYASQDNRAVFASAEISYGADRTGTDILLFAVAVVGCAGLLALARYLRVREAFTAQVANYNGASGGGLAAGIGCAAVGLMLVGFTIHAAIHADPFTADNLMAVPAGLMFVFAGILIGLPPEYNKWRNLLATLLVTCIALTFDWVAFGPGERKFSGSIVGIGFILGEFLGRAVFGVGAVVLDLCAIAMWIGQCRRAFGWSTSAGPIIEQERDGGLATTSTISLAGLFLPAPGRFSAASPPESSSTPSRDSQASAA